MFITAIFQIVYYNDNKKSPRARSLNYAGNEYDFEYDFFQLLKNDENDIFLKYEILQRLRMYNATMETVFEICYNSNTRPQSLDITDFSRGQEWLNTGLNTTYLYYHVFKQFLHSIAPLLFRYMCV